METIDDTRTGSGQRLRRRATVWTALLLAFALLAAACGGSDESDDTTSEADDSASASVGDDTGDTGDTAEDGGSEESDDAAGDDDADAPADADDDSSDGTEGDTADEPVASDASGILRFGRNDITSLDPHKASVGPDVEILFITYDRLVHTAPDGSLVPGLAESWEFSDDALTLTLHVREGVTFHDGEALDAEAVKASLDRARTVEGSAVAGELAPIEETTVVDPMTVELALSAPTGNLPALLSDRAGAIISPAALDNADLDVNPVGAGMYRMTDYAPGASGTFVAYDGYWDPDAQGLAGIEWTIFGDAAAMVNALRADQIDVAALAPSAVDTARSDGLQIIAGPTRQVYYLNLNETRPGLDDVRVRRAIAHAIDRNGIVQALFFGEAEAASQLFPEGEAGHDPDIAPDAFAYDIELAGELLAEAGYGPGELSYDLISFPSSPVPEINEVIAAGLSQIGIDVNIVVVDVTDVAQTYFIEAEGDMMQGAWSGRPSAEQTIQLLTTSTGFGNPGGFAPDGYDDLFAGTAAATTPEEREAGLIELARINYEEVLSVPIVFPFSPLGAQDRVQGLERYVTGKQEFRGVTIADS